VKGGFVVDAGVLRAERPPALLLGGLDLLRPLGYADIPAIVATPEAHDPALDSRYCRGRLLLPPLDKREAVIGTLLGAGLRLKSALGSRVPLYYGTDDHLSLISDAREALEQVFLLLLNPPEVSRALLDKDRFQALARERALPVPRALAWDELGRAAGAVLVKPRLKTDWEASAVQRRLLGGEGKARVFASGRAVLAHPLALQLREQLTFQDYIPGDDRQLWSFHGFAAEDGALLAWFVGRKLRTSPPLTGMSSFLELARDDEVAALGREVAASVPLRGVFKIDFKRCAASGRLALLEINARFNLWHHLGAVNGVNLPRIAYDYLVHRTRPAASRGYGTHRRWLCPRLDWRAYRGCAARGELGFGAWLASLAGAPLVYDTFSWSDPLPWIRQRARRAPARLRRELRALGARLQQWLSTAS
jgi:predicted ATP-grasp superfamily ATP-dependent carboligase